MVGIYKFTNKINGKSYIGQSRNIDYRKKSHLANYNNPNSTDYNGLFHRAIRKYGKNNFVFEILEECDCNDLNEREKFYIQYYNTLTPNGYNMVPGGFCAIGTKLSLNDVEDITDMLRNTNISNKEIAKMYGVIESMIGGINTGAHWKRDIAYPIRKTSYKKKTLNISDVRKIIKLIETTNMTLKCIGQMFEVGEHAVSAINRGNAWKQEGLQYPIRNSPLCRSEQLRKRKSG